MLSAKQVDRFVDDGFVHVESAFPAEVAARCTDEIWAALDEDPHDPSTWTRPVARLPGFGTAPFREAATTPVLHEAFDQLVGPGRWVRRVGLGTVPVRFPVDGDPGDDGWHLDASFTGTQGEPLGGPAPARPRAIAQPPLLPSGPIDLDGAGLPVAAAVVRGLAT